jgi:hypothetical protein
MKKCATTKGEFPSRLIDARIPADEELGARKVGIACAFLDFLVERFNDAPWREPCALDQRM